MTRPTPRDVLTDPATYSALPALFAEAWAAHAAARGREIDPARLGPSAHLITPADAACARAARIRARVARHVRRKGYDGPAPLILNDAALATTHPRTRSR
ncbi:MAG: hypothetical protein P1U75_14385 [Antarcticimicrobium sp.]|uniref:hypothetical protein n=1 Tax=Antarcticimicrobium sp. TaxID=2824147 RepID=UPI002634C167|nr:hypothetical protein [Antarcticimicrobium sp.]MDF1717840.1 hypothetical protein [Antarcticimicrobium sp.]